MTSLIRISVTHLDQFRLFNSEDWMTEQRCLESITGRAEMTDAMQVGIEFEDLLMDVPREQPRFRFVLPEGHRKPPQPSATQVPYVKEYKYFLRGRDVRLSGRVDAIYGDIVVDWKTTGKAINYSNYADAFQWRAYLMMSGLDRFRYGIYQLGKVRGEFDAYRLVDEKAIYLDRYDEMENDVHQIMREYTEWMVHLERIGKVHFNDRGYPRLAT